MGITAHVERRKHIGFRRVFLHANRYLTSLENALRKMTEPGLTWPVISL